MISQEIQPKKSIEPITPVEEYASASNHGDPLLYPGERPNTSFCTDGSAVTPVGVEVVDGAFEFSLFDSTERRSLDKYLADNNVEPMESRVPVLAYGANACPGSLKQKLSVEGRSDLAIVPTIYGELQGYDVVWSNRPGQKGNFIAQLYAGPETADTAVSVGVNFLTREQLLILHGTEMNYEIGHLSDVDVHGIAVPALCYIGRETILIDGSGKPVAVRGIDARGRQLDESTTEELLNSVLEIPEVDIALKEYSPHDFPAGAELNARQYVEAALNRKLVDKKVLQSLVGDVLATLGHKHEIQLQDQPGVKTCSWANPSTIPSFGELMSGVREHESYLLPHQLLPKENWPDEKKRDLILSKVSKHYHNGKART